MFRSLSARLTATYVFAAIVLVLIVVVAVTTIGLSLFAIATRAMTADIARAAPEEYRFEMGRSRTLMEAAPGLAKHLARPGFHILVLEANKNGHYRWLASSDSPMGRAMYLRSRAKAPGADQGGPGDPGPTIGPGGPGAAGGGPPGGPGGPGAPVGPGGPGSGRFWAGHVPPNSIQSLPFGLNIMLGMEPRFVTIPHGRIGILPDSGMLAAPINAFLTAMIPIGLFVVGAAWLLGRYITGQALRPLVETTASLHRFGAGDFTPRPIVTLERNEIGELARAYNAAAAQVSAAFEDRSAAERNMRQFIADAGHELRTPLTVIMGFIDVLRRRAQTTVAVSESRSGDAGMSLRIYETMLAESRRMRALIDKLILLARLENPQERELETVDLGQVATQVVAALQVLEGHPRVALRASGDAVVRGYENELHDALANLVENALKYAPQSPVDVRVRVEGAEALAEVSDRGPGISSDEQERVFDRFYRGRDHGEAEGFGLGLAIAKRAVERAGGRIALSSAPGEGTRFTMTLPLAARG